MCYMGCQLQPVDDDSRKLTTWDKCAWKPKQVAA
jgi:hypothetical protein